ncbi:hypothetical protein M0D68_02595 [Paraburkholderia sp. SEWSISQ10-3 4]|uniref:hypothetical protein n=1 Tax=Paraburkholderia TaxID=1822464 RepID=UPI002253C96C|nr:MULTISPECIES: hypothetical protein [Paraburkholderia]MCX4137054.1 hypothetical protein [Paraburkholderia aspalathi]MDN7169746.1 hypothetical protein [Paraburkholderia sp. SEWSISQ10-3 4]MDQ6499385.1 hypothetical protein [Paraburkholderia aspalathi]
MTVSYAWHLLMKVRTGRRSGIYRCGEHELISRAFDLSILMNAAPALLSARFAV